MKSILTKPILTVAALLGTAFLANAQSTNLGAGNTNFGNFSLASGGFNTIFGGFGNHALGFSHTIGTGSFNLLAGLQNVTAGSFNFVTGLANTPGGSFNIFGGQNNAGTGNQNLVFGSFLSDGGLAGSVMLSDGNVFGLRTAGARFTNATPHTFNGSFNNGYFLFTNDGQGANPNAGLFIVPTPANTAAMTNPAFVGINKLAPTQALDVVGNGLFSGNVTAANATLTGNLNLPATAAGGASGVVFMGGSRFLHSFSPESTFVGFDSGNFTMTGGNNTGFGFGTLQANTTGSANTAIGARAMQFSITGLGNTAVGDHALFFNLAGSGNTAVGESALFNSLASDNTAVGSAALNSNTTGAGNTALGRLAGTNLTTGSNNICIGFNVTGVGAEADTTRIGSGQTRAFVAGVRGITTGVADAIPVLVDSAGQFGTVSSSRRFKEDIADMGDVSDRLRALRPVTFKYREPFANGGKPIQYGLIAEEVAAVFPELAVLDAEGRPETVKYHLLAPLLLNEVQKLEGTVKEKDTAIGALKKEQAALEARLTRLESLLPPGSRRNASLDLKASDK